MRVHSSLLAAIAAAVIMLCVSSHAAPAPHYLSTGCTAPLRVNGFEAGLATATTTGLGGTLYVAEPEINIGIVHVAASNGSCTLQEASKSPASDPHTITLESIGVFPPRPF